MKFDFDNERPIYLQLVEKLKIIIVSGYLKPGDKLPPIRELALMAKVNPNTLQKALTELEIDKLIITERTNGKYVTTDERIIKKLKKELALTIVKKYQKNMADLGIKYPDIITYLQELGEEK